jgi:regulator of protease activity HflC (stomatin/prohibitin superfamily)
MSPFVNLALVVLVTVAGLLLMLAAMRKVPDGYRGVLFRFGRLVKELPPGMAWVFPLIDQVMLVNLGEQTIDLPPDLEITSGDQRYKVEGSFTCKVVKPIPAVMAAMQAQQDLAIVVGHNLLAELKQMDVTAILNRPDQATKWALEALNSGMSSAWQVKFTNLDFRLVTGTGAVSQTAPA